MYLVIFYFMTGNVHRRTMEIAGDAISLNKVLTVF